MKQTDWKIIYNNYDGPVKRAINFLSKEAGRWLIREPKVYRIYVLPCEKEGSAPGKNTIFVGLYEDSAAIQQWVAAEEIPADGYLVKIIPNPEDADGRFVIITAHTPVNVYYGAVSFIDDLIPHYGQEYCPNLIVDEVFNRPLDPCCYTDRPDHKVRSIFTWGHSINDYRAYIDNMARQKFNELILWNDFLPLNIREIIDYAHSYGIAVNLGYSWGWSTNQCSGTTDVSDEALSVLKDEIIREYEEKYAETQCDGIYFQSFTERKDEYIGDRLIAEAVTSLVNMTSGDLLKKYPGLKLQFGLHASSVHTHLDEIEKVDPRVQILWEDCGEFPYGYAPLVMDEAKYAETLEFTKKLLALRDGANVGLLFKGVMMLDWTKFVHQQGPYVMGENHAEIADHDRKMRTNGWRGYTALWMRSGERAAQMLQCIADNKKSDVEMCLAGTFDGGIYLPMALCAQMLWNNREAYPEILRRVAKRSCIAKE